MLSYKEHRQKEFEQRQKDLEKVNVDNYESSPYFQQNSFTKKEMIIQPLITLALTIFVFLFTGIYFRLLHNIIRSFQFSWIMSVNCLIWTFLYLLFSFLAAIYIKIEFYNFIALENGFETFTFMDEFYLYDLPVNPINIPIFMIINRPKKEEGTPEQFLQTLIQRLRGPHRCEYTVVKKYGKHFFKVLSEEEIKKQLGLNYGVVGDIKNDKQLIEFGLKIKSMEAKTEGVNAIHCYYIPELNEDEAAIMVCGPHFLQDGTTLFQSYNALSDQPQNCPFQSRRVPNFLEWAFIYITFPFKFFEAMRHYWKNPDDKNIIKKHPRYISGKLRSATSLEISVQKIKELSKKNNSTINDLSLALISNVLKEYFDSKNEKSNQITMTIPFSFKTIPQKFEDYEYGNQFTSLTLYMKIIGDFQEALVEIKKSVNSQLKKIPGTWFLMLKSYSILYSETILSFISKNIGGKHTMLFSNVAGFVKPVYYFGGKAKRLFYLGTGIGNLATGITMVSVLKRLQINVTTDQYQIEDIDSFIEIINKHIKKLQIQYDENEEGKD